MSRRAVSALAGLVTVGLLAVAWAPVAGAQEAPICKKRSKTFTGKDETIRLGFDQGRKRAWLFDRHLVTSEVQTDSGYEVAVRWTDRDRSQYRAL